MKHVLLSPWLAFAFILLAAGCAHHRDVRPGADGINKVVARGTEKEAAERDAVNQAEHYCSEVRQQHAAFVTENSKYTGTMDEETRSTVKKASTAAMVLGGAGSVAGRGAVRSGGNVLGAAGTVGHIMVNGDDYVAEMTFKCQ